MPKMKTHKATAKRFKRTARGRLMRFKIGKSHLRRKKPRRVKALFSHAIGVETPAHERRVRRLAPYLKKGK
jgi:large subunit ribosomal protein L35